jgi:uncharacterized protein YjbI with pentapeptide repeats
MKKHLSESWQQFRTSFAVEESQNTTIETGKAVLEAAKTFKEQSTNVEALKFLLQNSSSLLDILCSPLTQVLRARLPFVPIGIALLRFYREVTKQYPSLEDCVFIVSQAAYLESVIEILSLYPAVNWDANLNITKVLTKQLQKISEIELDYHTASQAIACFHQSELAPAFNKVLLARLTAVNIPKANAILLTKRVAWNTHRYMVKAWIQSGDAVKNVIQDSLRQWYKEQQKLQSIDTYLQRYLTAKSLENIFDENFAFKDIYVPLKAKYVNENPETVDLEKWAKEILLNPNAKEQVIFIQGYSGSGKSFFCQMFADWVRQHLYPIWTPILIEIKDIASFESSLESILEAKLQKIFFSSDDSWLKNHHIRFLFILDGLDELQSKPRINFNIEAFIKKVARFQHECNSHEMGHRVLITGRAMSMQSIHYLSCGFKSVEILEMDKQLQEIWLNKWEILQGKKDNTAAFWHFLQSDECPPQVQKLAQEPLLLYLLAAMYQDGKLAVEKLKQKNQQITKTLIYQEALNWVVTKHHLEGDRSTDSGNQLNVEITNQEAKDLKRILTEAAVCVVQSGGKYASISMLEARLEEDETAKALMIKAKRRLIKEPIKTAFAAFYVCPTDKQESKVEFFHKSFSDFLFAECLKTHFKIWTQYYEAEDGRQLITTDAQMNWEIYDLLGFGRLTSEIVEYVIGLLIESQNFPWEQLFRRLENFYRSWCQGKFVDSAEDTLPQKKLRQLHKYGIQKLGQRQVDIYTGLNMMILLLELHRYAQERDDLKEQIVFSPSRQAEEFYFTNQLLHIINYSDCIQPENFNYVVGQFLSNVNLDGAILSGVDLSKANLCGANLSGANLSGAILSNANLSNANLSGAILSGAILNSAILNSASLNNAILSSTILNSAILNKAILNSAIFSVADLSCANLSNADLQGAILRGAILTNADLSDADLSGVDFSSTILRGANLSRANLSNDIFGDIVWDENTNWDDVQGLDTAINVPEALLQELWLA